MSYSSNIPAYVAVYNALYSDIMNEVYKENDQLPSESILSGKYGVSRNTLRQALAVLNEDGLIIKSQGKGTLIAERKPKNIQSIIFNPMRTSVRGNIDHVDYIYNFGPPTDIAKEILKLKQSDLILASNNIYYMDEVPLGFSFVQIPLRTIDKLSIDVSEEEKIQQLIEEGIYEGASKGTMNIKLIYANEMEVEFLQLELLTPLLMLETILSDDLGEPMARCKYYFIPDFYDLHFQL